MKTQNIFWSKIFSRDKRDNILTNGRFIIDEYNFKCIEKYFNMTLFTRQFYMNFTIINTTQYNCYMYIYIRGSRGIVMCQLKVFKKLEVYLSYLVNVYYLQVTNILGSWLWYIRRVRRIATPWSNSLPYFYCIIFLVTL